MRRDHVGISARVSLGSGGRTLVLAHRGDHREAVENTLAALRSALALEGVDGVELDVRASVDGVPVLLHDPTLARVQGRPDRVGSLTAAELDGLGVPTLEAALSAVPSPAFLDVELKEDVAEASVAAIGEARGPHAERIAVSSFEPDVLDHVGRLAPSWRRWLNADRLDARSIDLARSLRCRGVSAGWRSVDAASVEAARAAALEVAAWTVTSSAEAGRLASLGIDVLCVEGEALTGLAPRPRG